MQMIFYCYLLAATVCSACWISALNLGGNGIFVLILPKQSVCHLEVLILNIYSCFWCKMPVLASQTKIPRTYFQVWFLWDWCLFAVGKFYAQFNNIMAVLSTGKQNNELAAVHLMKSFCLPSLPCACEMWSLNNISACNVNVALNNSFRKIFNF